MRTQNQSMTGESKRQNPPAFRAYLALLLLLCFGARALNAQSFQAKTPPTTRVIVRTSLGLGGILNLCKILGCSNAQSLGDPQGQLFMIQTPAALNVVTSLLNISILGLVSIETDQNVQTQEASAGATPNYLTDEAPYSYYGTSVWHGYVYQPGNVMIRTDATHGVFNAGAGVIVADIDTGVDPTHPVLKNVLTAGYDFTRNSNGGSEMADVSQSSVAVLDKQGNRPSKVSQSAVAVLDQSAVAVLDGPGYEAFGHGTMTAGIIHLVAPQAQIMPLKAFQADGSGYNSNILRAIYYAIAHGAKVINMSFNYTTYSQELANAVNYANENGVICVAAAGNSGEQVTVYPAALKGVIDVASTSNNDTPSTFSNYGAPPVWLAAPGEGVMTTYPFGTYAAGWGTSFSTPMVTGTAALMMSQYKSNPPAKGLLGSILQLLTASTTEPQAASALAHTHQIPDPQMGKGRLDTYQAMQAWCTNLGLH
jgi:subtilisin family serine protease